MKIFDRTISTLLPVVPKPLVGYFSRPYIAGPAMDDAFQTVKRLATEGAMSTLDILGEFIYTPEEAARNTDAYSELIQRIDDEKLTGCNVSVKLTALGLSIDPELCRANLRSLLQLATERDNFVRIDMEDSSITTPTLDLYRSLRSEFPGRVGAVVQAMLRRTLDDIDDQTQDPGANFRLCKGIYVEPFDIAFADYDIVRRNFAWALERLLRRGAYVGIATHDEMLVWEALRLIRELEIPREGYEFQMLLGVRDDLRRVLLGQGHRLRVYVPFGSQWYAYSVRRLRENPAIAGHAFRALFKRRS